MDDEVLLMNAGKGITPAAVQAAARGAAAPSERYDGSESDGGVDPSFAGDEADGSEAASSQGASSVASAPQRKRSARPPRVAARSPVQVAALKGDLLFKLDRLAKRGLRTSRPMTVDDCLEDIQIEFDRLDKEAKVDRAVAFQRQILVTFANGVEMLNSTYDPVGLKLDGWSGSVNSDIDSYDEVFSQLGEKYGMGASSMPPELTLLMMVASSGFMFHLQNSLFKQAPGLDEVLRSDPDLAQRVAAATARKMQQTEKASNPMGAGMAGLMSGMFGGGGMAPATQGPMSGPSTADVDAVLDEVELFSDESDSDDADSVLQEVNEAVRSGRSLVIDA
jgi:hypothetical protein